MYEEKSIDTNGIRLHVILAGPEDGRPIVLLHGFPEFWYSWRYQIEPLAAAGYRVIVPDQRGYNLSDKPKGVKHYQIDGLCKDIIGLLDRFGYQEVDLIGHDWGGTIAWKLAADYPTRLRNLIILNAPHLDSMEHAYLRNPTQLLASWYIFVFQIPWFAEHVVFYPFATQGWVNAELGSQVAEDMARYRESWAQPGAVQSSINWYRAAFRAFVKEIVGAIAHPKRSQTGSGTAPIRVRTLVLWGEEDRSLSKWLAHDSIAHCTQGTLQFFPGAGHKLQQEKPQEVTQAILDFLGHANTAK